MLLDGLEVSYLFLFSLRMYESKLFRSRFSKCIYLFYFYDSSIFIVLIEVYLKILLIIRYDILSLLYDQH